MLLASTIVGVGSIPASAHCSLGPFDAAIRFSDNVWVGEIVDGKEIDDPRTPYALTLRVDDVLSGQDPGPETTILAMPCKKLNGIAPSTIPDYVGIKGVFAIADVPTGFFYVETFLPEGDPVSCRGSGAGRPRPVRSVRLATGADGRSRGGGSRGRTAGRWILGGRSGRSRRAPDRGGGRWIGTALAVATIARVTAPRPREGPAGPEGGREDQDRYEQGWSEGQGEGPPLGHG